MTLDEQKIQLADSEHALEVAQAEQRALWQAQQLTSETIALQAKQKQVSDLIKVIRDLKSAIYG